LIFSNKSNSQDAEKRMMELSMAKADIEKLHVYSKVSTKTALELAVPLWEKLQQLSLEVKTKILSSMSAGPLCGLALMSRQMSVDCTRAGVPGAVTENSWRSETKSR